MQLSWHPRFFGAVLDERLDRLQFICSTGLETKRVMEPKPGIALEYHFVSYVMNTSLEEVLAKLQVQTGQRYLQTQLIRE
jgi:hypothetical protein